MFSRDEGVVRDDVEGVVESLLEGVKGGEKKGEGGGCGERECWGLQPFLGGDLVLLLKGGKCGLDVVLVSYG